MPSPIPLSCHNRPVTGPFGLLSRNENGLTYALGFLLARHQPLLAALLRALDIPDTNLESIKLQKGCRDEDNRGFTDIEIEGRQFSLIIEAKKAGWPKHDQLSRYAKHLLKSPKPRRHLCALGVTPACDSNLRDYRPHANIHFKCLRWFQVLQIVRSVAKGAIENKMILHEYSAFIEEVIAMQSYNTEVLVRSINFDDPSRDLYYDNLMYNGGSKERTEPLFFAPCFDKGAPLGMDGIQFISRVYYQDRFNIHNRAAAKRALAEAKALIDQKIEQLANRKTTQSTIDYLRSLHNKWEAGIRRMPSIWKTDTKEVRILFLGEPMRLPTPLLKEKGSSMIAVGFGMMLESLFSTQQGTFRC